MWTIHLLSTSYEKRWVASGSFDRSIKLWDIAQPREDPLLTLLPPDSAGPKSSVYALATDPMGHVVASGGPERVIRTWDPRSGKRIGKLVGHTDNIRVILVSDDSRYVGHTIYYTVPQLLPQLPYVRSFHHSDTSVVFCPTELSDHTVCWLKVCKEKWCCER